METIYCIAAIILGVLVFAYGVWVGEQDKKEGREVNHDFGM